VGKLSGAVGTFSHLPPEVEEAVCERLGLKPAPIASQVLQRDRHAEVMSALAICAAGLETIATEIRALQKTEVREVEEPFGERQKGSSAMPHKRNPVGCEQISGLARLVRTNALASFENIALWHERDISHSAVERVIIPDSTILIDYMLARLNDLITNLVVYPENMRRNLNLTGGVIYSQRLMLELVRHGVARAQAYEVVQRLALQAYKGDMSFRDLAEKDVFITQRLKGHQIAACFAPKAYTHEVETIMKRVFGRNRAKTGNRTS
jgi:adenylosuccinate lyase